jgi:hypothetical protein
LVLNAFLQLCRIELNLQTAVNETVKTLAADFYPAELLYLEGKDRMVRSKAGEIAQDAADRIGQTRGSVIGVENLAGQYRAYLPAPVLKLADFEKENRTKLEQLGEQEYTKLFNSTVRPVINGLFTDIVAYYANTGVLKKEHLHVVRVNLPEPGRHDQAEISIEAEYEYSLPVPFLHRTITLRKRAAEWAWAGS